MKHDAILTPLQMTFSCSAVSDLTQKQKSGKKNLPAFLMAYPSSLIPQRPHHLRAEKPGFMFCICRFRGYHIIYACG